MRPLPARAAAAESRGVIPLTASLYLLIFAYAVSTTMLGPLIPVLRQEYSLTLSQAGLMTTLQGVGAWSPSACAPAGSRSSPSPFCA
jgi:fucose permease